MVWPSHGPIVIVAKVNSRVPRLERRGFMMDEGRGGHPSSYS